MKNIELVTIRNTGNDQSIVLPPGVVAAMGWVEKQALYLHSHLDDGIWISAKNDSNLMEEIVAATKQLAKSDPAQ